MKKNLSHLFYLTAIGFVLTLSLFRINSLKSTINSLSKEAILHKEIAQQHAMEAYTSQKKAEAVVREAEKQRAIALDELEKCKTGL